MANTATNDNELKSNYWPWVSVFLAVSPIIGYFVAYLYESQYFSHFGIPFQFMVIDWTDLIKGMFSFLSFALILLIVVCFPIILQYSRIRTGIILNRFIWLGCLFLFVTLYYLHYSAVFGYLWISYILPLLFIIQEFIVPYFAQSKIKGFRAKLIEQSKIDAKKFYENNPEWAVKYGKLISILMIVVFIICLTALSEGKRAVINQDEFLVSDNYPSSVILKAYKDYLICAPVNKENHTIIKDFTIIPITQPLGIELRLEKLGTLKPQ